MRLSAATTIARTHSVPAPSCGDGGGAQDSGRFSVASDGSKPSA